MNNLVAFRRKLLRFPEPGHSYIDPNAIPRYYSTFYPWLRISADIDTCTARDQCTPSYYEIQTNPPIDLRTVNVITPTSQKQTNTTLRMILVLITIIFIVLKFSMK